jgi:hypothetical protein
MSAPSVATMEAPQPSAPINHVGRLFGVFFSPKTTFEDIAKRPSWVLPVALMAVLGLAVAFVMNQKVDWRDVASKRIEESPRAANLSAEQKQQQIEMSAKISPPIAYFFGVAWPVLQALIVAGIMLLAFNLLGGADGRFGSAMNHFPCVLSLDSIFASFHSYSLSESTRHGRSRQPYRYEYRRFSSGEHAQSPGLHCKVAGRFQLLDHAAHLYRIHRGKPKKAGRESVEHRGFCLGRLCRHQGWSGLDFLLIH